MRKVLWPKHAWPLLVTLIIFVLGSGTTASAVNILFVDLADSVVVGIDLDDMILDDITCSEIIERGTKRDMDMVLYRLILSDDYHQYLRIRIAMTQDDTIHLPRGTGLVSLVLRDSTIVEDRGLLATTPDDSRVYDSAKEWYQINLKDNLAQLDKKLPIGIVTIFGRFPITVNPKEIIGFRFQSDRVSILESKAR